MTELVDGQGRSIALGPRLGRGGEGEVFEVAGQPGVAAKVLHSPRKLQGKPEKVRAMVERPPAGAYDTIEGYPVLTWPKAPLYSSASRRDGDFRGYTMTQVSRRDFVPFFQLTTAARRKDLGGPPITWDRLVLLGMRLCHVVRTLHRFGYAVGDLNDRNVLVSRRLTPLLMDTDSFQVPRPGLGHFPSVVGDQLYWPPELLDVDLAKHKGSREAGDRYALGVLLFQLFMDGLRPYQARGPAADGFESLVDKTRAGCYPWAAPKKGVLEPPAAAPTYAALPKPIRQAFERCFVAGHRHPSRRPSADEWHAVLAQVHAAGFQACPRESRHVFGKGERACPWCLDPNDPFDATPRKGRVPKPSPVAVRWRPTKAAPAGRGKATARARQPPQRPVAVAQQPARPVLPSNPIHAPTPARRPSTVKPRGRRPAAKARANVKRSPPSKTRGAKAKARPMSSRWPARAAWLAVLAVLFASPAVAVAEAPSGLEKQVVTSAATVVLVAGLGVALSWHGLAARRAQVAASWLWLTAATAATLALGAVGRWDWLAMATGLAGLLAGAAVFVALERRRGNGFRPTRPGVLHGLLGLPAAWLPAVALWTWTHL